MLKKRDSISDDSTFASFAYVDDAGPMISSAALHSLVSQLRSRDDIGCGIAAALLGVGEPSSEVLSDRVLKCRGLELNSLAGRAANVLRVEHVSVELGGRWVLGEQLRVECQPGDIVYLVERSRWTPMANDTPGLMTRISELELTASPRSFDDANVSNRRLPLARITADGQLDPWFWPRLARIDSHPLSVAAADALLRLMKTATVPASRGLQYRLADTARQDWARTIPILLDWAEESSPNAAAMDWPAGTDGVVDDANWVRAIYRLVTGVDLPTSQFPVRMRSPGASRPRELMMELKPQRAVESRPADGAGPYVFQFEYRLTAADQIRFKGDTGGLCLLVEPIDESAASRSRATVRQQGSPERFKEFLPRREPLWVTDVAVDRPFTVELNQGRLIAAALYRALPE